MIKAKLNLKVACRKENSLGRQGEAGRKKGGPPKDRRLVNGIHIGKAWDEKTLAGGGEGKGSFGGLKRKYRTKLGTSALTSVQEMEKFY